MFRFKTLALAIGLALASFNFAEARSMGGGGVAGLLGGSSEVGLVAGVSQSSQEYLNTLITRANARSGVGPISTSPLNSAYEFGIQYGLRFSGSMLELLFRPTFFYEKANGSGTDGSYNYGVTGFTFFPILRLVPLENDIMKFFLQAGLGYGRAYTSIQEGAASADGVGDAFGTLAGMGAEFCITAVQCISLEGNYRYLTMERNIASNASGTFASDSLSRAQTNREIELDQGDLAVRMGGLQFLMGYVLHF